MISTLLFQFTPLREGRRASVVGVVCADAISIHAPPRGATRAVMPPITVTVYFNSRPSARGDMISVALRSSTSLFQFTPLREGRRVLHTLSFLRRVISIHAPPRGATPCRRAPSGVGLFQFTPLREGRRKALFASACVAQFQFTPLREGRHSHRHAAQRSRAFQFTPLREGRQQKICNFCKSFVQPLQISMA